MAEVKKLSEQKDTRPMEDTKVYKAGCHCGNIDITVRYEFHTGMECNCSHCSKKGYITAYLHPNLFEIDVDEDQIASYEFCEDKVKHYFCKVCGCAPFAVWRFINTDRLLINLRCVDGLDLSKIERVKDPAFSLPCCDFTTDESNEWWANYHAGKSEDES